MIQEYIPQILMVISAAVVLFLVGKKVPGSLKDLDKEPVDNTKANVGVSQLKDKIVQNLEKMLRRIRVFFSRSDARMRTLIRNLQKKKSTFKEDDLEKEKKRIDEEEKDLFEKEGAEKESEDSSEELAEERLAVAEEEKEDEESESAEELITDLKKEPKPEEKKSRLAGLRRKFKRSKKEDASLKRLQKPEPVRPPIIPIRDINIQEARKVMFEREERVLIKKIAINPKNDEAYVALGKLYKEVGNLKDAQASLKQALKINKGNISAKRILEELNKGA